MSSSQTTPANDPNANSQAQQIPNPPEGKDWLKWLGPSFIWMLSAAGSGELLFTPRVAALYSYALLWALVAAVVLKWLLHRLHRHHDFRRL